MYPRNLDMSSPTISTRDTGRARRDICVMANDADDEIDRDYKRACGKRLRRARYALNYPNQAAFAEITGVGQTSLSNWERGVSLVPPEYTKKLKRLFQITHDWIYSGDPSGLKQETRDIILSEGVHIPDTDE